VLLFQVLSLRAGSGRIGQQIRSAISRPSPSTNAKAGAAMPTIIDQSETSLISQRTFSNPEIHPYDEVEWKKETVAITSDKGEVIFQGNEVEVPSFFSSLSTKILSNKYFYGDKDSGSDPSNGGRENSFKQVLDRVVDTISDWGLQDGYFDDREEAELFNHELKWLCLHQYAAFNSPVWFNVGLYHKYGIDAESRGNHRWDSTFRESLPTNNHYQYPQASACFIQHVADTMESIMNLATSESRLFKYGSGSGSNLSRIRSRKEKLSGGGSASGPLSFMEIYDTIAGTVRSGGKTRRAALMKILNTSHPDVIDFIECKVHEEKKAWALIEQGYDGSFDGEAYRSVRFQNANLSLRPDDEFMKAAKEGREYWTRWVKSGEKAEKHSASKLLDMAAEAAHMCGDPGMQFDSIIHEFHTCKASGRQHSSNPCSEFLFLDDSACNLASINLLKFLTETGFDHERFAKACEILIVAQDILVDRSSYPTPQITRNSHAFRPLGLGYSSLGALLMSLGHAYSDPQGRNLAALITAVMTASAYETSTRIAAKLGPFEGLDNPKIYTAYDPREADGQSSNRGCMHAVLELHRDSLKGVERKAGEWEDLHAFAMRQFNRAIDGFKRHGARNSQVSVLAPCGTIGFLMGCDTTGIEPAMGLIQYKTLAGGGMLTIPNHSVATALTKLGYAADELQRALEHVEKYGTLESVEDAVSPIEVKHLPVFDTAFVSGRGKRSLHYKAHIDMLSAVQPFLSGGISKTINMPREATVKDVRDAFIYSWERKLKGVAIYRDGSKGVAPVKTRLDTPEEKTPQQLEAPNQMTAIPYRQKLPETRQSITHKYTIGSTEGYITVGLYDDGRPGEVFIKQSKAGSSIQGFTDTVAILLSMCLQHGVPLTDLIRKLAFSKFDPSGFTRNPDVPMAHSCIDYLMRWMGMKFVPGYKDKMSPATYSSNDEPLFAPVASMIVAAPSSGAAPGTESGAPLPKITQETLSLLTMQQGNLICPECGSARVQTSGTCATCLDCGTSLGCS
jgi:ribonucleoside-diphosphate reductase alpha chain